MFLMTCDILFGSYKPVQPNYVKWTRSIDSFSDTALVKIPAICMLKKVGDEYERVQTGLLLKEGMKAEVWAGYDGLNYLRFKGFIRRVNFSVPLEVECEGYSYQLRIKVGYTKSYLKTTVREILADLIEGTDIVLSDLIPDIPLEKIYFKNVRGTDVLEYLKEKCLLTLYFNHEVLYCGLRMTEVKPTVRHRLNWNVVKDSELKFEPPKELAKVVIQVEKRGKDGHKAKAYSGPKDGSVEVLKISAAMSEAYQQIIAEEKRKQIVTRGYEGAITTFLVPYVEPGMSTRIDDIRYTDRTGTYFIEKVDGEFGPGGGRQKISIGSLLVT